MGGAKYYLIVDGSNVARAMEGESAYLDHHTGDWVAHPSLIDNIWFEADTQEISLTEAQQWVKSNVPHIDPIWVLDSPG